MNFYMFEGGTNFGFMSGKNNEKKTGIVTSYDYDAPLTEDGRITEKYEKCKEVISRYTDINEVPLTTQIRRLEYGEIRCTAKTDLFSTLDSTPQMDHHRSFLFRLSCPDFHHFLFNMANSSPARLHLKFL